MYRLFSSSKALELNSLLHSRTSIQSLQCLCVHTNGPLKESNVLNKDTTVSHENVLLMSELPGPSKIPYFGTFLVHARYEGKPEMLNKHVEWSKTYGPIYKETVFGNTVVYVNNVESAEKICRAEGKVPLRVKYIPLFTAINEIKEDAGLEHGLADSDGEEWVRKRRIYSKRLLRPIEMKNYFTLFSDAAVNAVEMIKKNRNEENVLKDQKKYLIKWSMDSFSTFVFGKPFGFMNDIPTEDALNVDKSLSHLVDDIIKYSYSPSILQSFYKKHFNSAKIGFIDFNKVTRKHLIELMDRREKEGVDDKSVFSFADYILSQDNLGLEECTAFASDVFGGGYDTTTNAMDFLLYLIGTHPDIQEKMHKEICDSMPENGILDYNTSQQLPYMRAVLKEAFRLNPIGAFLPRALDADITLNGYMIPKKTTLLIHSYAISRSEDHFDKPSEFIPERWLRGADKPPHPYLSLPFGTGARSCIGRRVAEGNMFAFMAQFLKAFKIEEVYNEFTPVLDTLLKSSVPIHLKLSDR